MLFKNPAIYEINARLLVRRQGVANLLNIPDAYWKNLFVFGVKYVWLMGVWKIPEPAIRKYCFEEGLVNEYKKALHDWNERDVAGSPYAIDDYKVDPRLGVSNDDLRDLKRKLNGVGLKLILDFIPNHFSAESELLKTNPEIFLQGNEFKMEDNPRTFFRSPFISKDIFAHGKDPNFEAWQDTTQINYFADAAKVFMINKLLEIAHLCDGVRCDMAMLVLSDIFAETWDSFSVSKRVIKNEFWKEAIDVVKKTYPEFLFIAEAYWDREWDLQQLGFDYTYDKRLYDRLTEGNVQNIKDHLKAEDDFQKKLLRFVENHDEKRAAEVLGKEKSKAAAVIISTIPGMRFYFEGQCSGRKIKLPVQLNREPFEKTDEDIFRFYQILMEIAHKISFEGDKWKLLDTFPAWEENFSNDNFLVWQITGINKSYLVCVNYSGYKSQCRIFPEIYVHSKQIVFQDLLNKQEYIREVKDIKENGLFVELGGFESHMFHLV